MCSRAIMLAAALVLAPLGAGAADLVVVGRGYYAEENEAVAEIIDAFEYASGTQVELVQYSEDVLPGKIEEALEAHRPPDFAFGYLLPEYATKWAYDDRLVDLSEAVGTFSNLFDADALERVTLLNETTGQKALYAVPMGRYTNHVHVWKSLLERAGFTREDIPREWDAFWSFWCDEVQPAVRQATGRDDTWGVGLTMSAEPTDTLDQFFQFVAAYDADYVTRDGKLVINDPEIRQRLIKAIDSYTSIYRKGCTPPGSVTWDNIDNNEQFIAQAVVMTPNGTLSIPNAIKQERPEDYHDNVATIEWPLGPTGEAFPIINVVLPAVVLKDGAHVAAAEAFVRFLVREGWLAHYLNFSAERMLPTMPALLNQPFWLDVSDRHRMAAVMEASLRSLTHNYAAASGNWRHDLVVPERVWAKAVHRIVTEGVSPEQAVDEAIARVKEILGE